MKKTEKYRHFNHHRELTEDEQIVDFGDGEFIANKAAIPLLKALSDLGLQTRTHHVDDDGGFVGILLSDKISIRVGIVNEHDATRTKYNGMTELLISWFNEQ